MSPVGKTKDVGWEIGVSRTLPVSVPDAEERDRQRTHWRGVLDEVAALLPP